MSYGLHVLRNGERGFTRNLLPGEMVDQVMLAQEDFGERVSDVVGMGQGEPLLNYDNVLAALRFLNSPDGLNIGARRIAISTCGLLQGIDSVRRESRSRFARWLYRGVPPFRKPATISCLP